MFHAGCSRADDPDLEAHRQPAITTRDVRQVGQPITRVIANVDRHVAEDAAQFVEVAIEARSAVTQAQLPKNQRSLLPLDDRFFELTAGTSAMVTTPSGLGRRASRRHDRRRCPLETVAS